MPTLPNFASAIGIPVRGDAGALYFDHFFTSAQLGGFGIAAVELSTSGYGTKGFTRASNQKVKVPVVHLAISGTGFNRVTVFPPPTYLATGYTHQDLSTSLAKYWFGTKTFAQGERYTATPNAYSVLSWMQPTTNISLVTWP